jgi:hypothetical protein
MAEAGSGRATEVGLGNTRRNTPYTSTSTFMIHFLAPLPFRGTWNRDLSTSRQLAENNVKRAVNFGAPLVLVV